MRKGMQAALAAAGLLAAAAAGTILLIVIAVPGQPRVPASQPYVREGAYWVCRHPLMVPHRFLADKPPGVFRVFVIGGSQAMGSPYVHYMFGYPSMIAGLLKVPNQGGIATWLPHYLAPLLPGRSVEAVNAAVGALDLAADAEVFSQVAAVGRPDLVVVLAGDNERDGVPDWSGDYCKTRSRADFAAKISELTAGYARALDRILRSARDRGIPLLALTVPDNIREWVPTDADDFGAGEVSDLLAAGRAREARSRLEAARRTDNALWDFHMARCWEALGDSGRARLHYLRARDNDKSFYRCRSPWNDVVRKKARGGGVRLLDLEKLAFSWSRSGSPGYDLFHDYCHFTLETNRSVAREIARSLGGWLRLPPAQTALVDSVRPPDIARGSVRTLYRIKALQWVRLRLFAAFSKSGLLNAARVSEGYRRSGQALSLADDLIRLWDGGRRRPVTEAGRLIDGALRALHPEPEDLGRLAVAYQQARAYPEALEVLDGLIRREPRQARWLSDRGVVRMLQGRGDLAARDWAGAIALDPDFLPPYLSLGGAHAAAGRRREALRVYDAALARGRGWTPDERVRRRAALEEIARERRRLSALTPGGI